MIIFYADAGFQLDLTGTGITLVEENDMFNDYFTKDYSLPFEAIIEKFSDEQIRFLHFENVKLSDARYPGHLFVDSKYRRGYLVIKSVQGKEIKGIVYYGGTAIPLLETKLPDLPFPINQFASMAAHAKDVISKQYPDVGYNFPMIIDEEFSSNTGYDKFQGIINNYESGLFVTNSIVQENGESVIYNRNVVTPYPYIMEILRLGFASVGIEINGDFVNDKVNEKVIWDTSKYLERFSTATEDDHIFEESTDEYVEDGEVVSEFVHQFNIVLIGTFKLKMLLNLPQDIVVKSFQVLHNGGQVYFSQVNNINKEIEINVSDNSMLGDIKIKLKTAQIDFSISDFNQFEIETNLDKLNIFHGSFRLGQVLPDITFAAFLKKLKTAFNLKIVLDGNVARIDYVDRALKETQYANKTAYEIAEPLKEPSAIKLYKLIYNSNESMYVGSSGEVFNHNQYGKQEIGEFDLNMKVLPISNLNGVFTAKRSKEDPDFKLILYDGLQTANNLPVAVETVLGRTFKLPEVYSLFYKSWIHFLLNSVSFTDKFECDVMEEFDINQGQFKYNAKHIFTRISKTRKSERIWEIECKSLS